LDGHRAGSPGPSGAQLRRRDPARSPPTCCACSVPCRIEMFGEPRRRVPGHCSRCQVPRKWLAPGTMTSAFLAPSCCSACRSAPAPGHRHRPRGATSRPDLGQRRPARSGRPPRETTPPRPRPLGRASSAARRPYWRRITEGQVARGCRCPASRSPPSNARPSRSMSKVQMPCVRVRCLFLGAEQVQQQRTHAGGRRGPWPRTVARAVPATALPWAKQHKAARLSGGRSNACEEDRACVRLDQVSPASAAVRLMTSPPCAREISGFAAMRPAPGNGDAGRNARNVEQKKVPPGATCLAQEASPPSAGPATRRGWASSTERPRQRLRNDPDQPQQEDHTNAVTPPAAPPTPGPAQQ